MSELVVRARASIHSARLILEAGDPNSAISRAYYGMFDLARAALLTIDPELIVAKTHASIISRFARHAVRERNFPNELGKALRRRMTCVSCRTIHRASRRRTMRGLSWRRPSNSSLR